MTKQEAENLKRAINQGYNDRNDYPPFAITSWVDRFYYREYIFRIIDEFAEKNKND